MSDRPFTVSLTLDRDYRFSVDFEQPGVPELIVDEPPTLGSGTGPNPVRLLAGAVGNCLGSSLLYCLRKARIDVAGLHIQVQGTTTRDERGRLRVADLQVRLHPAFPVEPPERYQRCLEIFEDFCIVTQSVRNGISVDVSVEKEIASETDHPEVHATI